MGGPVRFAVVRELLERHGWVLSRVRGSHHTFTKPGAPRNFPVPVHKGLVKHVYFKKAKALCGEE